MADKETKEVVAIREEPKEVQRWDRCARYREFKDRSKWVRDACRRQADRDEKRIKK